MKNGRLTPERWRRVEELVHSSLERAPEEWGSFLDEACGGDTGLRAEVESLLEQREAAQDFIERPAFVFAADALADDVGESLEGRRIGPYKVIREIGRGGMGTVYLGRRADEAYQREVAIKLIKRGMDTEFVLRRFRRERRILASLDHPNVARLLDGGTTDDGLPYFVMEYVEGAPINDYADARKLSTPQRLRLFRTVCAAVQYAHQNLIIHRDLKPSNVLVTAEGVPKLLDFGIAKLLDPEDEDAGAHTVTEFGVMTPEYASPEQVQGLQVTTATDVYSLGVILYELLAGHRPYRVKSHKRDEIARAVCEQEPERPSAAISRTGDPPKAGGSSTRAITPETVSRARDTQPDKLRRRLAGDLDNIVLMAMRKEASRRYASVGQFSDDLRRHLEGLPVIARKDTFRYRSGKFVRRNRVGVAAAALVLLSLMGGIIATVWQARRAEANQARAEKRFADVRGLSNALLNDIAPKIERLEGSTEARQALVSQSLKYLDSLAGESAGDLVLQAELASAYEKVGVLQGDSRRPSLSDFRGAIASLEKAQQIRLHLLEIKPGDAENRRLLADNLRLLAIRRIAQSDADGGLRDSREALQIYENLVAETPGSLELQRAFLGTQVEDATNYTNLNRDAEAIPLLRRAAGKIEELRRTNAGDTETERLLARCLASLGLALSWESHQPEAEAEMTRAVTIAESLAARFPNDTNIKQELWKIYESASGIYEQIDDARAFELCEKSRRVAEEMIAADPADAQARHNLSKSFSRLGVSASHLGKPAEALGFLEQAMAIVLELQEKDPLNRGYDRDLSALYIRIGLARFKQRDYHGALAAHQKGAELYEKQLADDAANTIALRDSAIAYRHAGLAHKELAKTGNRQTRQIHLAAEKGNYQRALDALLKAQAQKALPEFSRKLIETYRKEIEELEKLR